MSEAGEATTTTSTSTTLPQAPAEAAAAAPQDPAPKSPVGSGAPQAAAPAPAALVAGNPGGDAAPAATGTAAPASSAPAGSEDAEKKVLGESGPGGWGPLRVGRAAGHVRAAPAAFPTGGAGVTAGGPQRPGPQPARPVGLPGARAPPCAPPRPVRASPGPGPASWGLDFCHLRRRHCGTFP